MCVCVLVPVAGVFGRVRGRSLRNGQRGGGGECSGNWCGSGLLEWWRSTWKKIWSPWWTDTGTVITVYLGESWHLSAIFFFGIFLLGCLLGEVFWACSTVRRPQGKDRTRWRNYICQPAWEYLSVPPDESKVFFGESEVWVSLLGYCPRNPATYTW